MESNEGNSACQKDTRQSEGHKNKQMNNLNYYMRENELKAKTRYPDS